MQDEKLLIKIANLYYVNNLSLEEIGSILNCSVSKISRLLKEAHTSGIISITIKETNEPTFAIEKEFEKKFGLNEVIICNPTLETEENIIDGIGKASVGFFLRVLPNVKVIALTYGETMYSAVRNINIGSKKSYKNTIVVPSLGNYGIQPVDYNANNLTKILAEKIRSNYSQLNTPLMVDNKNIRDNILLDSNITKIVDLAKKADIIFLGIGSATKNSRLLKQRNISTKQINEIIKNNGIGEIGGRFFTKEGNVADLKLDEKTIGLNFHDITKIPIRVGLAGGIDKIDAIYYAIKNKFINILIIDIYTANKIIKKYHDVQL